MENEDELIGFGGLFPGEYEELRNKLKPIVLNFAEKHFRDVKIKINYEFGSVTIEV